MFETTISHNDASKTDNHGLSDDGQDRTWAGILRSRIGRCLLTEFDLDHAQKNLDWYQNVVHFGTAWVR